MRTNARLQKLETAANASLAVELTIDERFSLFKRIDRWLHANDFQDELAAIESGIEIPDEMADVVAEYSVHCKRRREFEKFERSFDGGDPLTAADLDDLTSQS